MSISTFPLSTNRLTQIATDACTSALSTATTYQHDSTAAWNNSIINSILRALISETTPSNPNSDPEGESEGRYKFAVNSTIIQHLSDVQPASVASTDNGEQPEASSAAEGAEVSKKPAVGRRGMHSASGAYWNNERDGMWSFKYEGGESKGMDIVVSMMWIGV